MYQWKQKKAVKVTAKTSDLTENVLNNLDKKSHGP